MLETLTLFLPFGLNLSASCLFPSWVLLFLIRLAGLWTMNNRALAKTDPDALHAFPTPAGSVVTAQLSLGWLC